MSGFYHVTVGSLPEYEDLVAEIYINDKFVGLISQENGPQNAVFEIAPTAGGEPVKVDLDTLERAIAEAKQRLWDLRRSPPADQ